MVDKKHPVWATGKRKTAVARIRLIPGSGVVTVNARALEDYFPRETSRMRIMEPLEVTEAKAQYDILASVKGGGIFRCRLSSLIASSSASARTAR